MMTTRSLRTVLVAMLLIACLAAPSLAADKVDRTKPVKVFILSGQSNMEGKALSTTLDAVIDDPKTHDEFKHLKPNGKWLVRNDVWVTFLDRPSHSELVPEYGPLTVGYGSEKSVKDETGKRSIVPCIGPELAIGYVLGNHYGEQVLLIKAAWGGRSVKYSFRPPSAMPSDDEIKQEVADIKARKGDADVTFESRKEGYGSDYRKVISETHRVLDDLKKYFPDYDPKQGYEIAGFIWFQGWNDMVGGGNPDYTEQMAHFIKDMRRDLKAPNMPFVIGELGAGGVDGGEGAMKFRAQQAAVAEISEFKGNVAFAKTAIYWPKTPDMTAKWDAFRKLAKQNESKPKDDPTRVNPGDFYQKNWEQKYKEELKFTSDRPYHYMGSGACYYQMGESMGKAMLDLIK